MFSSLVVPAFPGGFLTTLVRLTSSELLLFEWYQTLTNEVAITLSQTQRDLIATSVGGVSAYYHAHTLNIDN